MCKNRWMIVTVLVLSAGIGMGFAAPVRDEVFPVTIDAAANAEALPGVWRPGVDLSGRGEHREKSWPQSLAAHEAIEQWEKGCGLNNFVRIQYNLWELNEASKDPKVYEQLNANYAQLLTRIHEAGGTAIISFFGMPANLSKVKDKKSPPVAAKAWKDLLKRTINDLSCEKKLTVWYEVWSAPDLDDFFIGNKKEYFAMYAALAGAVKELEKERGIHIPIGGPSSSWWFQNFDGNTISTVERSLIYEFIRYCGHYRLPIDFISWHAYTTDPRAEEAETLYRKSAIPLIRAWLTYFHFDPKTPLIIDEWNYDCGDNVTPARAKESFMAASYIPARLTRMQQAGIDYAVYYSLEDFKGNAESVVRNVGLFGLEEQEGAYRDAPKATFVVFKLLARLASGKRVVAQKNDDEFISALAARSSEELMVMVSNYIDPGIVDNYLTRSIGKLSEGEKRQVVSATQNKQLNKYIEGEMPLRQLSGSARVKNLFVKAQQLYGAAAHEKKNPRQVQLTIKNLQGEYVCERITVDAHTNPEVAVVPGETLNISAVVNQPWKGVFPVAPYSVEVFIFKKAPPPPPPLAPQETVNLTQAVLNDTVSIEINATGNTTVSVNGTTLANVTVTGESVQKNQTEAAVAQVNATTPQR